MKKKILSFVLAICLIIPAMFCLGGCKEKEEAKSAVGGLTFNQISIEYDFAINSIYGYDYKRNVADLVIQFEVLNNSSYIQELKPILFKRDIKLFNSDWDCRNYNKKVESEFEKYTNEDDQYKFYTVEYLAFRYYYSPYDSDLGYDMYYSDEDFAVKTISIVPGEKLMLGISFRIYYDHSEKLDWWNKDGHNALIEAYEEITYNISYNNIRLISGNFINLKKY